VTRDQRQLLLLHKSTTGWQTIAGYTELLVSEDARRLRRRYAGVSAVLSRSIREPDDLVQVDLGPVRGRIRNNVPQSTVIKWLILAVLVTVAMLEYRSYSLPVLREWFNTVLRRCGIST
jgi:hypothetical protein